MATDRPAALWRCRHRRKSSRRSPPSAPVGAGRCRSWVTGHPLPPFCPDAWAGPCPGGRSSRPAPGICPARHQASKIAPSMSRGWHPLPAPASRSRSGFSCSSDFLPKRAPVWVAGAECRVPRSTLGSPVSTSWQRRVFLPFLPAAASLARPSSKIACREFGLLLASASASCRARRTSSSGTGGGAGTPK